MSHVATRQLNLVHGRRWAMVTLVIVGTIIAVLGLLPQSRAMISNIISGTSSDAPEEVHGPENTKPADDGHNHDHAGHEEGNSIELSKAAQKNIGLEIMDIKLQDFQRAVTLPGLVIERPGRSNIQVSAPLSGIVTRIYPDFGEAVEPGQPLFDLRLMHEELVQAQADILRTAQEMEVIKREVARLERVSEKGAVAGKTYLERKYELEKQEAVLNSQRQALLLHGLNETQVDAILVDRSLLQNLTVRVPGEDGSPMSKGMPQLMQVQELNVVQGQQVDAGETLAVLSDHVQLFIEGRAFEQDVVALNEVATKNRAVSAVLESRSKTPEVLDNLQITYLANKVDSESRTFHFYVGLPNELLRESKTEDGRRFIYWRFKPGQRMQLRVPVETWTAQIVLPVDAVAQEGPESYVFQPNGDHFDRIPVHVEYRDQLWAVIEADGSLYPGDKVASSGAHQLHLALKNKAGGAPDPHAGHNH